MESARDCTKLEGAWNVGCEAGACKGKRLYLYSWFTKFNYRAFSLLLYVGLQDFRGRVILHCYLIEQYSKLLPRAGSQAEGLVDFLAQTHFHYTRSFVVSFVIISLVMPLFALGFICLLPDCVCACILLGHFYIPYYQLGVHTLGRVDGISCCASIGSMHLLKRSFS